MTEEEKKIKLKYFPIAKEKCPFHNEDLQNGYYEGFLECAKELEKENNKLLDVINNQDVKIADLEKELAENQSDCALCYSKDKEQLQQAKEIIKELINIINYLNEDEYGKEDFPIVHKAEQFLKEIEK